MEYMLAPGEESETTLEELVKCIVESLADPASNAMLQLASTIVELTFLIYVYSLFCLSHR